MFPFKRAKLDNMSSKDSTSSKASLIVRFYDPQEQAKDARGRTLEHILSWPDSRLESCHDYIQMLFPLPEGSLFNGAVPLIDRETMGAFRSRSELRRSLRRSFERMMNFYGFELTYQAPSKDERVEDGKESIKIANGETTEAHAGNGESSTVDTDAALATSTETKKPETTTTKASTQNSTPSFPPGAPSNNISSLNFSLVRSPHWRQSFNNWVRRSDHNHLRITRILRSLRILGLQKECDAFSAALKEVYQDPAFNISATSLKYWMRAVTRPLYIAPDDGRVEWLKVWEKDQEQEAAKIGVDGAGDEGKVEGEEKREENGEEDGKAVEEKAGDA